MLGSNQSDGRAIANLVGLRAALDHRHVLPALRNLVICLMGFVAAPLYAADVGAVRGVVHDAQHHPIAQADVQLRSVTSDWAQVTKSDSQGTFAFSTVPLGNYVLSVSWSDFAPSAQTITVTSGATPAAHIQLLAGPTLSTVTVTAPRETTTINSATPTTLVNREDIERTQIGRAPCR